MPEKVSKNNSDSEQDIFMSDQHRDLTETDQKNRNEQICTARSTGHTSGDSTMITSKKTQQELPVEPLVVFNHNPTEPPAKPRIFHNGRDISLSMIPLILICLAIAALSGNLGVRFGPGQKSDQYPPYEAAVAASAAARELPFNIRFPILPQNWKPNSGSKENVSSSIIFNLGWLTPQQHYIQLSQSSASIEELIGKFDENHTAEIAISPDPNWKWFSLTSGKSFGISHLSGETIAIIGNGATPIEFQTMLNAIEQAHPLSRF